MTGAEPSPVPSEEAAEPGLSGLSVRLLRTARLPGPAVAALVGDGGPHGAGTAGAPRERPTRPTSPELLLAPEELPLWEDLPAARRDDFLLGRVAAGQALAVLGLRGPVLRDGRRPRFPPGALGSLSHTGGRLAVALTTRWPGAVGVGVDVERTARLSRSAARLVCEPRERAWALQDPTGFRLGLILSAKESAYKAVERALSGRGPRPHDVRVRIEGSLLHFDDLAGLLPPGLALSGEVLHRCDDCVVTAAMLHHAPDGPRLR